MWREIKLNKLHLEKCAQREWLEDSSKRPTGSASHSTGSQVTIREIHPAGDAEIAAILLNVSYRDDDDEDEDEDEDVAVTMVVGSLRSAILFGGYSRVLNSITSYIRWTSHHV